MFWYQWHDWACMFTRYVCKCEFEGSNLMTALTSLVGSNVDRHPGKCNGA